MSAGPLIVHLQRVIERTYDLDTGIDDIAPYIIGREGYSRLYAASRITQQVGAAGPPPEEARMMVTTTGRDLRVALYYPDRLVENLERNDPTRRLTDENIDDFATLVEELDHLLALADRLRTGAEISLLELELHANVTKVLVLDLFVARMRGTGRLDDRDRSWVRHHLFGKLEYREVEPSVQARYRDAAALAIRYLDHLLALPAAVRPAELRRFHRRSHHEKLAHIARLAS